MTPTQAQIEAAMAVFEDHYWDSMAYDKAVVLEHIKATLPLALTAAHEAWLSETFSERWQAAKDRAAAAEVCPYCGERAIMGAFECRCTGITTAADGIKDTPCGFDEGYKYKEAECKDEIAATIERCAQVAESYANDAFHGEMIAAEIRALKDKP